MAAAKKTIKKASPIKKSNTPKASKRGGKTTDGTLDQKILSVLSGYQAMKVTAVPKIDVCEQCGYKALDTKTFREAMKRLKDRNHIEYHSGKMVSITPSGHEASPVAAAIAPLDNSTMHKRIKEKLAKWPKGAQIFEKLLDGKEHDKKVLCEEVGYKALDTKAFREPLAFLKKMEWMDSNRGSVQLTDKVFPHGRPSLKA
eukprot:CAMPEP_0168724940 /NCGR_PEP_ID=MMETSP0724-20121128/3893_1 /TAXON_ID=265536 /ORGANISM="Amphiprora sp., Strain CCMP467" /LENGTH=199 /DNA_ID=CAMNT_0008771701 /DNA_START=166 /DNA_END=765 /DNA_ORIENTATION=-